MPPRLHLVALWFLPLACLLPLNSQAGLFDDTEARQQIQQLAQQVEQLKTQVKALETGLSTSNGATQSQILNLQISIDEQKDNLRKLTGTLEALQNRVVGVNEQSNFLVQKVSDGQKKQTALETTVESLEARLRTLEKAGVTPANNQAEVQIDGVTYRIAPGEDTLYHYILSEFQAGRFNNTISSIKLADGIYPKSELQPLRSYWLGNSHYAMGKCKEALPAFASLLKSAPTHPNAPDSLFNTALCQRELKQNSAAEASLEKLVRDYPNAALAAKSKEQLEAWKKATSSAAKPPPAKPSPKSATDTRQTQQKPPSATP